MGWNLSRKCDYVDQELCSCFLIRRCCRRRYENVLQPSLRVGLLIGQVLSPSGNPACLMGREINARRVLVCVWTGDFNASADGVWGENGVVFTNWGFVEFISASRWNEGAVLCEKWGGWGVLLRCLWGIKGELWKTYRWVFRRDAVLFRKRCGAFLHSERI